MLKHWHQRRSICFSNWSPMLVNIAFLSPKNCMLLYFYIADPAKWTHGPACLHNQSVAICEDQKRMDN